MRPDAALDKLLLLTLTIEEAVLREDLLEADQLFRQRDLTLDAVELLKVPKTHPTVALILEADRRLGLLLATRSQELGSAIRKISTGQKAARAYSRAG